jgi:archaellum component FlaC
MMDRILIVDSVIKEKQEKINKLEAENKRLKDFVQILSKNPTWLCSECSTQWDIRNNIQLEALKEEL